MRVAYWLKWRIFSGECRKGNRLPTSHALAELFGVNINTALAALALVREQGLITMGRGKDIVVAWEPPEGGFDRVTFLLERIETDCRALQIPVHELAGAMAMREAAARAAKLVVRYIDANHPNFDVLVKRLKQSLPVPVDGISLENPETDIETVEDIADIDIALTPAFYAEAVSRAFADRKGRVMPLVAKVAPSSYAALVRLHPGSRLAIGCQTNQYARISERVLKRAGLGMNSTLCSLEDPDHFWETLRTADSITLSPPAHEYALAHGSGDIHDRTVLLQYDFDRDSLGAARTLLHALACSSVEMRENKSGPLQP